MTIRQWSYLDGTLLAPGQPAGSITPSRVQDAIDTINIRTTVSVLEYNPSAGDGSTDGTAAFTSAIAAGYKTVYVPDGTYIVTGITLGNAGQCLWISPGATIKLKAAGTSPVIHVTANNVVVTGGGTVDGNRANAVAGSATGVYIDTCTGVIIQGINVAHTINEGIRGNNCSQLKVRDNFITDTAATSIFIEVTTTSGTLADVEVSRNYIDRTAESAATIATSGIQIHASGTSSLQQRTRVTGNTILLPSNPSSTSTLCIEIFAENHGTVANDNTCSGASWGISFDTSILGTMTGNTIFGAKQIGLEFAACTRCTMSGNTVDGNAIGQTLLNINDGNEGINDYNTIVGNTCQNGNSANDKAVLIFNANGCTFSGNTFKHASSTNQVVYFNGGQNISYSGGIVDGGATSDTGILFDACTTATVTGVFFQNLTGHPVLAFAETATTVDNIMVAGCTCVSTGVIIGTTGTGTIGNNISAMNCHGSGTFGKSSATSNGNVRWGSCLDIKNDVWDFVGSGSPNSSVTASPGSIYRNQAGGTTTTLYVKESGSATNTGWVAK